MSNGIYQMNDRLWYPQLDPYDCVRRVGVLLSRYEESLSLQRLRIADFYLANPPLLHFAKMKKNTRHQFNALHIVRPSKSFLAFPAPALLYGKMEPIQKEALSALGGKGLLSMEGLQQGVARFTQIGWDTFASSHTEMVAVEERNLVDFLIDHYVVASRIEAIGLHTSNGLWRLF